MEESEQHSVSDLVPVPPTLRELQLEALVRERDAQVLQLSSEIKLLRKHISTTAKPVPEDDVQVISTDAEGKAATSKLLSIFMPHILPPSTLNLDGGNGPVYGGVPHPGVTHALQTRAKLLQEENDELYAVLKRGETGRLDEEVKALRRLVSRLEVSLRESNDTVRRLSDELDLTRDYMSKNAASYDDRRPRSLSPTHSDRDRYPSPTNSRSHHPNHSPHQSVASLSSSKPIPTGPRALKKPRLSSPVGKANGRSRSREQSNTKTRPDSRMEVDQAPTRWDGRRERDMDREPRRKDYNRVRGDDERDRGSRERGERDRGVRERLDRDQDRDRNERASRESPRITPTEDREHGARGQGNNGLQIRGVAGKRQGSGGGGGGGGRRARNNGTQSRGLLDRIGS